MSKRLLFFALIILFSPSPTLADAPQFSDYPAIETTQESNPTPAQETNVKDTSPELQDALKTQKFNYAGHYIIYTQSCGKNCIAPVITDTKTGNKIAEFRQYYIDDKQHIPFGMHQPNSNLLILSGTSKHIWEYPTQTY